VTFEPKDKVQQIKFIILLPGGGPELQAEDDRQAFEAAAAVGSPHQVNYLNVSIRESATTLTHLQVKIVLNKTILAAFLFCE